MRRRGRGFRGFLWWALVLLALLGLGLGLRSLVALAAALLGLLAEAWWASRSPLLRLDVRREIAASAFEDDRVPVTLVLENHGRRALNLVEITDAFGPGVADRQVVFEPGPLHARTRRRLSYGTFCSRGYGVFGIGPLSLGIADPLGLYRRRRPLPRIESFAVFPRLQPVAGPEPSGARPSLLPEEQAAARVGWSALYLGIRDYRPGDDPRRIHWPATARRGSLVVKEVETDLLPYLTVFLDLDRSGRAGTGRKSTRDYLVRTAAALLGAAVRRGETVELRGEGGRSLWVPPGRGELHLTRLLYELIRAKLDGKVPLLRILERDRSFLPPGSTAVALFGSTRLDEGALDAALDRLRAARIAPRLVFVNADSFVPVDRRPSPPAEAQARAERLLALCRAAGAPAAILGAEEDLAAAIASPGFLRSGPW